MEPATPTTGGSGSVAQAAATAVSPDPLTASLLAKHSAGERLTPSEYGKLGAFASRVKSIFTGKSGTPAPGAASAVGAAVPAETQANGFADPPPDADLVKRTTGAVLHSANGIAQRFIAREARKAGADDKTTNRFISAASLPAPTQELLIDTSPDLLATLGVNPRHYPLVVAVGALGLWGTNIWLCVDELRSMRKPEPAPAQSQTPGMVTPGQVTLPDPKPPKGAPPTIT